MAYEAIVAILIAGLFGAIFLGLEAGKNKTVFNVVLKDICLMLCFIFVLVALYTNTNLVQSSSISYTLNNTVITNYTYAPSTTLDYVGVGYGYTLFAFLLLFLIKLVFDLNDARK